MKKDKGKPADAAELRRRAEERVRKQKASPGRPQTDQDLQRLVHELQVHQIELEMQNEELLNARVEVETGLQRYMDLYDFAPVGYFTFRRDGEIRQVNLAGARLLGVERSRLVGRRFGLCVSEADRPAFDALLKTAFEGTATAACEVAILKEGTSPLVVRIEAAAPEDGRECRAVVADITERKRAEDAMERFRDELESRVQERTAELARTNDQLRILASELTLAEEHERRRLAVELHDGLDQNLSLAEMKLGELLKSPQATGLNRPLREIKQLIVQANRQARSLTFQLSPAVLYDIGLSAALEWLAEQMQLRHGIKITLEDDEQVRSIQIEPRILLFRALRELAINVVKHARASRAQVSIRLVDEDLRISIEDDGAGFDPATVGSEGSGLGLFGIRERLSPLGGRMEIDSARGRGTRVTLIVPAQRVIGEAP